MRKRWSGWFTQHEIKMCSVPSLISGCWEWQNGKNQYGYGVLTRHRRRWGAHRISYFLYNPDAPLELLTNPKLLVCHKCDNPGCVNPEHLFLGDAKANALDAVAKKRLPRGEARAHSKLTTTDILKIRALYKNGVNKNELKFYFKVSYKTIANIINKKRWNHV